MWRLGWLGWGGGVNGVEKNDWEYSQSNIYNTIPLLETYKQWNTVQLYKMMKLCTVMACIYFEYKFHEVWKKEKYEKLISKMSVGTQLSLKSGIFCDFFFSIVYILFNSSRSLLGCCLRQEDHEVNFILGEKWKQNKIKRGRKRRGKGESHEMFFNRGCLRKITVVTMHETKMGYKLSQHEWRQR